MSDATDRMIIVSTDSHAGVPPELGLVTAFTAMAAYAVFGTSRHLKVTVSSTMAVMSAAVVAPLVGGLRPVIGPASHPVIPMSTAPEPSAARSTSSSAFSRWGKPSRT